MIKKTWQDVQKNKKLICFCSFLYNLFMLNSKIIRRGNQIQNNGAFLKKCKIIIKGCGNTVVLEAGVRLNNCFINMSGNNAVLHIGEKSYVEKQTFHFEDSGCKISVGARCILNGGEFAAVEDGREITIGDECLFSRDVHIVTTDSHSILDKHTKKRINPGDNVIIGNHVWLTAGVNCLKGSQISDGCVVGRNAVITKKFQKENCVIAGCPGKYIKENIEWKAERI